MVGGVGNHHGAGRGQSTGMASGEGVKFYAVVVFSSGENYSLCRTIPGNLAREDLLCFARMMGQESTTYVISVPVIADILSIQIPAKLWNAGASLFNR